MVTNGMASSPAGGRRILRCSDSRGNLPGARSCERRWIGHTIEPPAKLRARRAGGAHPNREETDMRRIAGIAALAAVTLALAASSASADTKDKKIAFSNNYAGNSWRQAMLKSYDAVTKKAVADGVVGAADV